MTYVVTSPAVDGENAVGIRPESGVAATIAAAEPGPPPMEEGERWDGLS